MGTNSAWTSRLKDSAPPLSIDQTELLKWGYLWRVGTKKKEKQRIPLVTAQDIGVPNEWRHLVDENTHPSAFSKKQGMDFGVHFDRAVGKACADMLGDVPIADALELTAELKEVQARIREAKAKAKADGKPYSPKKHSPANDLVWTKDSLVPPHPNCIEIGPARVIGGVRPQNFDVAYRPDGPRIVYDSKGLNDAESIPKNWQNMVNDLGTEATTVHTRFPYAVVAFIVAVPKPAIRDNQLNGMIRTLERMAIRVDVDHQAHLAEAIALAVWDPETGELDPSALDPDSNLRVDRFMETLHARYVERYKGLPPHDL